MTARKSLELLFAEPEALKPFARNYALLLLDQCEREARESVRHVPIASDGDSDLWLEVMTAPSRRKLAAMVEAGNWHQSTGCGADCTGRVFQRSATLLRAIQRNGEWHGIVLCAQYRDY